MNELSPILAFMNLHKTVYSGKCMIFSEDGNTHMSKFNLCIT